MIFGACGTGGGADIGTTGGTSAVTIGSLSHKLSVSLFCDLDV